MNTHADEDDCINLVFAVHKNCPKYNALLTAYSFTWHFFFFQKYQNGHCELFNLLYSLFKCLLSLITSPVPYQAASHQLQCISFIGCLIQTNTVQWNGNCHFLCHSPKLSVVRLGSCMIFSNPTVVISVHPYKSMVVRCRSLVEISARALSLIFEHCPMFSIVKS